MSPSAIQSLSKFNPSIKKIGNVQKQEQSLILFHLFGLMITFTGLMKITGNDYGVTKHSKE